MSKERTATADEIRLDTQALPPDVTLRLSVVSETAPPIDSRVGRSGLFRAVGWPRAIPGLPQIRTCRIPASGSSGHGFAAR